MNDSLFLNCIVTGDSSVLSEIAERALSNIASYQSVEARVGIPWWVIACIHFRESSQNFSCHIHNGDPLTERTVHVPKDRPIQGEPPFSWVDSAVDAFENFWRPPTWDYGGALDFMERYNGLGYKRMGVPSPYLWDFTDAYTSGLFVADGKFDPYKKESRPGCASIMKTLQQKGVDLELSFPPGS